MTQEDVAKIAGVSRTTVSRVLNNDPTVNPKLRKKILETIENIGYKKNYISSSLASKSEKIVYAFIVKSIVHYYTEELIKGFKKIEEETKEFGYKINIIETDINSPDEQLKKLKQILETDTVSGIIITPLLKNEVLELTKQYPNIKFVSLDTELDKNIPHIGANYYNSGQICADIVKGIIRQNEKVLILKFPGDRISAEEYYKGFIQEINIENAKIVNGTKELFEKKDFLEPYLKKNIKAIFANRYLIKIIETNRDILLEKNNIKLIGIAGNPDTNIYVKQGLIYASVNEQYSNISYSLGKLFFEELYKDIPIPNRIFIKALIIFKSLLK